ncbi:MAG: type III-A CRISPR-associated protein Cas10/Csm1 [Deltaproteobacteria bacterium]|nr:type III-A CRISPR-associated protein Cas10/Csm1 [Deltaproteobacteria bacterium]
MAEEHYKIALFGLLYGVEEFFEGVNFSAFLSDKQDKKLQTAIDNAEKLLDLNIKGKKGSYSNNLKSIFPEINLNSSDDNKGAAAPVYYYPFKKLSPDICPLPEKEIKRSNNKEDYKELITGLSKAINEPDGEKDNIPTENLYNAVKKDNITSENLYNALCSILEKYCHAIPISTKEAAISLYDFCKIRSALTSAIYYADNKPEKLALIQGDFTGIQDFIFDAGGESNRYAAKILRGKSFFVSASVELASIMICDKFKIPAACVIMNAGGKFTIIAPAASDIKDKIEKIKRVINEAFNEKTFGQTRFNIAYQSFEKGKSYGKLLSEIAYKLECEKLRPVIDVPEFENYPIEDAQNCLCQICGKHKGDIYEVENIIICKDCNRAKREGAKLLEKKEEANKKVRLYFTRNAEKDDKVFGNYGYYIEPAEKNKDDIVFKIREEDKDVRIAVKRISGYAPTFPKPLSKRDEKAYATISEDKRIDGEGDKIEEYGGAVKPFDHLAADSFEFEEEADKLKGSGYLGILKADIDNLGKIFSKGFGDKSSFLKGCALSRSIDYFFCGWLQNSIKGSSVYTVFAGGDDLFLIGAWDEIIALAGCINCSLKKYAAKKITISAGIILAKPMMNIRDIADEAEKALRKAKKGENWENCRNRINIFGITVEWDIFDKLIKLSEAFNITIDEGIEGEKLKHGFLHNLINFADDAGVSFKDCSKSFEQKMEAAKWKPRLQYLIARNYGGDKQKALKDRLDNFAEGENIVELIKNYKEKMRIPLSITIYRIRRHNG